jgi:hypothetical protein
VAKGKLPTTHLSIAFALTDLTPSMLIFMKYIYLRYEISKRSFDLIYRRENIVKILVLKVEIGGLQ